ncbi:MAG: hypothetical protein ABIO44_13680 [Saprospiraceae bacterium]
MNQEIEYLPKILQELKHKNAFLCPDQYFEKNIESTIHRMEVSSLAEIGITNRNSFITPDQYFTKNIEAITHKIELKSLSEIGISNRNSFTTPDHYFNHNIEKTLRIINLQKVETKDNFSIPGNYFDTLNDKVMGKLRTEEVMAPIRKFNFGSIKAISIAALFVLMIGTFMYRWNNNKTNTEFSLNQIDDDTLIEYVAMNDVDMNILSDAMDEQNLTDLNIDLDDIDDDSVDELIKIYQ